MGEKKILEEPVILKKYPSAVFGTHLFPLLNTERVDTIIVAGCTTTECVRATVVDGLSYGCRMMVVQEVVSDRAEFSYRVSLVDIDAKYGGIVSARQLDYFNRLTGRQKDV